MGQKYRYILTSRLIYKNMTCTFTFPLNYCTEHKNFACLGPNAWLNGDPIPIPTHCGRGSVMTGQKGFHHGNYCKNCIANVHHQLKPVYDADAEHWKKIRQNIIDREKQQEQHLAQCRDEYRDLHMDRLKKTQSPIDHPGEFRGKLLVDLLLSPNHQERYYVKWLASIAVAQSVGIHQNFTKSDMQDFERCQSEARKLYNDLIIFGNNKASKSKRDASPTRK